MLAHDVWRVSRDGLVCMVHATVLAAVNGGLAELAVLCGGTLLSSLSGVIKLYIQISWAMERLIYQLLPGHALWWNYRLTSYLLITILLAGDVHSNPGPVCKVERKPFLLDSPQLVNATELHKGSDNRSASPTASLQNTILNLNGCMHKEHLN